MDRRSSEDGVGELTGELEFPCSGLKVCIKGYLNARNELSKDGCGEGEGDDVDDDDGDGDTNGVFLKACSIPASIILDPSSNSLTTKSLD